MNPFDILNDIPKKRLHTKEEVEKYLNIMLLVKYLSNNNIGLYIGEYLNRNYSMPIYDMYLFAFYILPKSVNRIKYNKREKFVKCEDYEYIMTYYNCSYKVAEAYYKRMSNKEFKRISSLVKALQGVKQRIE